MPCYEIRTVEVTFQVKNIDLLKKALELKFENVYYNQGYQEISFQDKNRNNFLISMRDGKLTSRNIADEIELTKTANLIKRTYSECVIDEIAKRNKWIKKKLNERQFQLQRF